MPPRFDTSVYTVGWVCASKDEVTASRAFLDEEHEQPPRRPNDNNVYIVGAMGEHKVVIAFPGAGSYGADVIAHTVAHMVRTFQDIRFGLMVGIGGGAPSAPDPKNPLNDIRLGDVVVSMPQGNYSKINSSLRSPCTSFWLFVSSQLLTIIKVGCCSTTKVAGRMMALKSDHT